MPQLETKTSFRTWAVVKEQQNLEVLVSSICQLCKLIEDGLVGKCGAIFKGVFVGTNYAKLIRQLKTDTSELSWIGAKMLVSLN